MLTNLIESRGKEFSGLLKIADYLGRSLRENVELFYIDNGIATFVTESNKVITGKYTYHKSFPKLSNIQVEDSSILENQEAFELNANKKVSDLLSVLFEDNYQDAENTFDNILSLFETKLSYSRIKNRLDEKVSRFGPQTKIVESTEFLKLVELKDKLVSFLKENSKIVDIPEIRNSLKLASVVANSFELPKITYEELCEKKTFEIKAKNTNSIYEHLCRQELIAKELLEAKQSFDSTWANNELISELASMIYEKDYSLVENKIAEIISTIPYFALSTKKQLQNLISNSLYLSELDISNKDLNKFVGKIYETKKSVKEYILSLLNEKYGINISNLTDIPSFSNLLKTEILIFNSLSKLAPKNSLLKEHLLNFSESLKLKNGVEAIDVMTFLNDVFNEAGYKAKINETSLMQYLDFNQVADDLGKIGTILKLIRPMLSGGVGGAAPAQAPGAAPPLESPLGGGLPSQSPTADVDPMGDEGDLADGPAMDSEDAANAVGAEKDMEGLEGEEGMEDPSMMGMPDEGIPGEEVVEPEETMASDDLTNLVASIEDLLNNIKSEIGGLPEEDGEDPEFDPSDTEEEGFSPEGEGDPAEEGDFDGGGEVEGGNEGDPEDDFGGEEGGEEEEESPKPKKPPIKK